jgi:hypothetical protein
MPSVNIYSNKGSINKIKVILPKLREFLAKKLSCGERELDAGEISIRVLIPEFSLPIADVEIVIAAHAYKERINRQDEICGETADFIYSHSSIRAYVWLQLSELGHSEEKYL